jgi:hypothetical protein
LPPCDRGAQQLDAAARASGQAAVEAEMDPTLLAK